MNVLFRSPLGGLLAKPWVDQAGLHGLRRWYRPLSRLWAAANQAGTDTAIFRAQVGALPAFWSDVRLRRLLASNDRHRHAAEATRATWDASIFDPRDAADAGALDDLRRGAATRHLMTRAAFYPLLFPRPPAAVPWQIDSPDSVSIPDVATLFQGPLDCGSIEMSRPFVRNGLREFWLRAPTPSAQLGARRGSEMMYARVVEPVEPAAPETLIMGSGLFLEFEVLPAAHDPGNRLAAMGWRVIQPISPYHGLRAMPGFYGGEPFFALAPSGALDLIAGQALETGLLTAWSRRRFGGPIGVGGISMSSFVAQQVASHCRVWPAEARPDAVLLISHSGRIEDVTFGGELAASFGIDRALRAAGWSRAALARLSSAIDPAEAPALAPSRIVSVLGETDRWVPFGDGLAVARGWQLPLANIFCYRLGHLGMPVQLARDPAPFERLRQVLREA